MDVDDKDRKLVLLPVHAAPRDPDGAPLPVRRKPGRPRKVRPAPVADELQRAEVAAAELDRHVDADPVVVATSTRRGPAEVARALLVETARAAASIDFELRRGIISGPREVERARSRRVDALVAVARQVLVVAHMESGDVPGHKVARVQALFARDIDRIAREVLPDDIAELLMSRFRVALATAPSR